MSLQVEIVEGRSLHPMFFFRIFLFLQHERSCLMQTYRRHRISRGKKSLAKRAGEAALARGLKPVVEVEGGESETRR